MRIMQLIDSLNAGGAERMAVNLFNSLNDTGIVTSFLVATRKEGILKSDIIKISNYLFLQRKNTFDFKAFNRLVQFTKNKEITHIHAHGSSYFIAGLLKVVFRDVVLIWHDHYGNSEFLNKRKHRILSFFSRRFNGIIAVNEKLLQWNRTFLKCNKCIQLNNFVNLADNNSNIVLKGTQKIKVICVANFRPQKNHLFLIKSFRKLNNEDFSLHLFGQNFQDEYSQKIINQVEKTDNIFYYGSKPTSKAILKQASIGILVSKSEGLPLILLEYAAAKLPVVSTKVGECEKVIGDTGCLIDVDNESELVSALQTYANDPGLRQKKAHKFSDRVHEKFGEKQTITSLIGFYKECS